jgi:uncharacterized protein (DUF2147 family)
MTIRKIAVTFGIAAATLLVAYDATAQSSPVGVWKSIDDNNGKPMALIRISEHDGELKGRIEKLFSPPPGDKNPKCIKCTDARKEQPVIGMTIIEGMHAEGAAFGGGTILDPDNGKIYKSRMTLVDDGKKLQVRGYIGMPLFGRTQTWLREE